MCLQALAEIFGNAVGLMILVFFGFIMLFNLFGFIIGAFIGGVALVVLILTNPLTWLFILAIIVVGLTLFNK